MGVNWTEENAGVAAVTQKAGWKVACTVPVAAGRASFILTIPTRSGLFLLDAPSGHWPSSMEATGHGDKGSQVSKPSTISFGMYDLRALSAAEVYTITPLSISNAYD
jgi:hypothetical protein